MEDNKTKPKVGRPKKSGKSSKRYYDNHKELVKQRLAQIYHCELCDKLMCLYNKFSHGKSKQHTENLKQKENK